jgi:hemerythrin
MFYRQGMILPGHPNNSGRKPLLIGRRDQVQAQLQYIYRGNYGLISEQEMLEAGATAEEAAELMRLKLRFAFGAIRHPREMLDTATLDDVPLDIRPGVVLSRDDINVFTVTHDGESVTVDLNLPPYQVHECPFPLGYHRIARDYFSVIHSGDGDGWDIRRPTMGSVLCYQGRIYLVDAGPNLIYSLTALGIGVNEVEGIFHTHSHDDHFAGLTTLIHADRRIRYYASPLVRAAVAKKLSCLLSIEEADFSAYFDVRDLTEGVWTDLDGLEVMPVASPHPVETTCFYFRTLAEGGYKTYAHLADAVSLDTLSGMIAEGEAPGLTHRRFEAVVRDYLRPADVKKVDVGGGLIHGRAEDFTADSSTKIILAHTSEPLSDDQKRIGSGASFGTIDVLVPGMRDYPRQMAFHHLSTYFPDLGSAHLQVLLNGDLIDFNPETILLKEGTPDHDIYLVLSGQVEMLTGDSGLRGTLSSGALIGELTGLHDLPAAETYRALCFVQALRLPCGLYRAFVTRHDLFGDISRLQENREFLQRTYLFGEVVSTGTLNVIAADMVRQGVADGAVLAIPERSVGLLRSGRLRRLRGGQQVETLAPGDFFGEEAALFETPRLSTFVAEGASEIAVISAAVLVDIPGVRWKLFETFDRRGRAQSLASGGEGSAYLPWHDHYSVNVQRFDNHHRRLVAMANKVIDAVARDHDRTQVTEALDLLLGYTLFHFTEEEDLLDRYGFPHHDDHCQHHHRLIEDVRALESRLHGPDAMTAEEVGAFMEGWIVRHILGEDTRYSAFLNSKGVY